MTPTQKIKWAILELTATWAKTPLPTVTSENIDEMYEQLVANGEHWDAMNEIRCRGTETGLQCEYSRHYESDAVAAQMPDGTWVGWTYWHGGGKHGQPAAIDWMDSAYDVDCTEEEKMVVVRTFAKVPAVDSGV